ncbi:MAG: glycosyltransferase [Bacteroidales bacterium]|jgi:glycosyltransferase involved in cell wall biosynthesis|nr:glycosyltransferase [Bacteroidales bacterium]
MNILFFLAYKADPKSGGTERVYDNLARYLSGSEYNCYCYVSIPSDYDAGSWYKKIFIAKGHKISYRNTLPDLQTVISQYGIDVVVCAYPQYPEFTKIMLGLRDVRIICHLHNAPDEIYNKNDFYPKGFRFIQKSFIAQKLTICWNKLFNKGIVTLVKKGAEVIVLSSSYVRSLQDIFPIPASNILAIPNPFNIDKSFDLSSVKKEKILLYVGRMNSLQKRVDLLLIIWKKLQVALPDWRMVLVGDYGRGRFVRMAGSLGLERIEFAGYRDPVEYYKRASALCLVSSYEGFPMVIPEAMQFGCIPFVFDSFDAVNDMVDDGKNGFKIHINKAGRYVKMLRRGGISRYCNAVKLFASKPESEILQMRKNAIDKSREFDVDNVWLQWKKLLDK